MSKQREALEMALQALEEIATNYPADWELDICVYAKNLLREALAEPEQEPVAWMCADEDMTRKGYSQFSRNCEGEWNIPVYTAQPARKPLTDAEIADLWDGHVVPVFGKNGINPIVFARAIESAHGIIE